MAGNKVSYQTYMDKQAQKKARSESAIFKKGSAQEQADFLEGLRKTNPNYYAYRVKQIYNVNVDPTKPFAENFAIQQPKGGLTDLPSDVIYHMQNGDFVNAPPKLPSVTPTGFHPADVSALGENKNIVLPNTNQPIIGGGGTQSTSNKPFWETNDFLKTAIALIQGKPISGTQVAGALGLPTPPPPPLPGQLELQAYYRKEASTAVVPGTNITNMPSSGIPTDLIGMAANLHPATVPLQVTLLPTMNEKGETTIQPFSPDPTPQIITEQNIGTLSWGDQLIARRNAYFSKIITGVSDYNFVPFAGTLLEPLAKVNPLNPVDVVKSYFAIIGLSSGGTMGVVTKPVGTGTNVFGSGVIVGWEGIRLVGSIAFKTLTCAWDMVRMGYIDMQIAANMPHLDAGKGGGGIMNPGNPQRVHELQTLRDSIYAGDNSTADIDARADILKQAWTNFQQERSIYSQKEKQAGVVLGANRVENASANILLNKEFQNDAATNRKLSVQYDNSSKQKWEAGDATGAIDDKKLSIDYSIAANPFDMHGAYTWGEQPAKYEEYKKNVAWVELQLGRNLSYNEITSLKEHFVDSTTEAWGQGILDPLWLLPAEAMKVVFAPFDIAGHLIIGGGKAVIMGTPIVGDIIKLLARESSTSGGARIGNTVTNFVMKLAKSYEGSLALDEFANVMDKITKVGLDYKGAVDDKAATAIFDEARKTIPGLEQFSEKDFKPLVDIMLNPDISERIGPATWSSEFRQSIISTENAAYDSAKQAAIRELGYEATNAEIIARTNELFSGYGLKDVIDPAQDFGRKLAGAWLDPRRVYEGARIYDDTILGGAVRWLREVAGQQVNEKILKTADIGGFLGEKLGTNAEGKRVGWQVSLEVPDKLATWINDRLGPQNLLTRGAKGLAEVAINVSATATIMRDAWVMSVLSLNPAWVVRNYVDSSFRHLIYGGNLFEDARSLWYSLQREMELDIGQTRMELSQSLARAGLNLEDTLSSRAAAGWKPNSTNPVSWVFSYFQYEYKRLGEQHAEEIASKYGEEAASKMEKNLFSKALNASLQGLGSAPGTIGDINTAIEYTLRLRMVHDIYFKTLSELEPKAIDEVMRGLVPELDGVARRIWSESRGNPRAISVMIDRITQQATEGNASWALLVPPGLEQMMPEMDLSAQQKFIGPLRDQLDELITNIKKNGKEPSKQDFDIFFNNYELNLQTEVQAIAESQGDTKAISHTLNTTSDVSAVPMSEGIHSAPKPKTAFTPTQSAKATEKLNINKFPLNIQTPEKLTSSFEAAVSPYATLKKVEGYGVTVTKGVDGVEISLGDKTLNSNSKDFYDLLLNATMKAKYYNEEESLAKMGINSLENYQAKILSFVQDPAKLATQDEKSFLTVYYHLQSDPHYENMLKRLGANFNYESTMDLYRQIGAVEKFSDSGFPVALDRIMSAADKSHPIPADYHMSGVARAISTRRLGSLYVDESLSSEERMALGELMTRTQNTAQQYHQFGVDFFPGAGKYSGAKRKDAWNAWFKVMTENNHMIEGIQTQIADTYVKDPAAGKALVQEMLTDFDQKFLERSGINVMWDADHQMITRVDILRNGRFVQATDDYTIKSIYDMFFSDYAHRVMDMNKPIRIDMAGNVPVKDQMIRQLRTTFELGQGEAESLFKTIDMHASEFEAETGKSKDLFYSRVLGQKVGTGAELGDMKNLIKYQGAAVQRMPDGSIRFYGMANATFADAVGAVTGMWYGDLKFAAAHGSETAAEHLRVLNDYLLETTGEKVGKTLSERQALEYRDLFIRYVSEDNAPSVKLIRPFENMKGWLNNVYKNLPESRPEEFPADLRAGFDHLFQEANAVAPTSNTRMNNLALKTAGMDGMEEEAILRKVNEQIDANTYEFQVGADTYNRTRAQLKGMGYPSDQVNAIIKMWDVRARTWAQDEEGRTAQQFWDTYLGKFTGEEGNVATELKQAPPGMVRVYNWQEAGTKAPREWGSTEVEQTLGRAGRSQRIPKRGTIVWADIPQEQYDQAVKDAVKANANFGIDSAHERGAAYFKGGLNWNPEEALPSGRLSSSLYQGLDQNPKKVFYSKLENYIKDMSQSTWTASDFNKYIRNSGQFKGDEIKWTGLGDLLAERGSGKITKQEMLDAMKPINVIDVMQGGYSRDIPMVPLSGNELPNLTPESFKLNEDTGLLEAKMPNGDVIGLHKMPDGTVQVIHDGDLVDLSSSVQDAIDTLKDGYGTHRPLQVSDFQETSTNQLSGSKFYEYTNPSDGKGYTLYQKIDGTWGYSYSGRALDYFKTPEDALKGLISDVELSSRVTTYDHVTLGDGKDYRELLLTTDAVPGKMSPLAQEGDKPFAYDSPHWDTPNTFAHIRFDTVDENGQHILRIQEIQSDWAKEISKGGKPIELVDGKLPPYVIDAKTTLQDIIDLSRSPESEVSIHFEDPRIGNVFGIGNNEKEAIASAERTATKKINQINSHIASPMPFEKNWQEVSMKSMLQYASENGYDAVRWPGNEGIVADIEGWTAYASQLADKKIDLSAITDVYTKDLPKFMTKYGKQWGITPKLVEDSLGRDFYEIPVTSDMVKSVMQGQSLFQQAKGATQFMDDGRAIISAWTKKGADISTIIHETWHVWRRTLGEADMHTIENWTGLAKGEFDSLRPGWEEYRTLLAKADNTPEEVVRLAELATDALRYESAEEKFARAGERYVRTGQSPVSALDDVFHKLKQWMTDIYRKIKGTSLEDAGVTPKVKDVFDRMFQYDPISPKYKSLGEINPREFTSLLSQITGKPVGDEEAYKQVKAAWKVMRQDPQVAVFPKEYTTDVNVFKNYLKGRMSEELPQARSMYGTLLWRIEQWQDSLTSLHVGDDLKDLVYPRINYGEMDSGTQAWLGQRTDIMKTYEQVKNVLSVWNEWLNSEVDKVNSSAFRRYSKDEVAALNQWKVKASKTKADMISTIMDGGELFGRKYDGAVPTTNHIMLDYQKSNVFDGIMNNFFPFWKFPSRSIPFWIEALATHPQIIATYNKLQAMSRTQLYQANAVTSQGVLRPSLVGYVRIPGTDNMWFNPMSPFSMQYVLDKGSGKQSYLPDGKQQDESPVSFLTTQFIENSSVYGFSPAPWIVALANQLHLVPPGVAMPQPIIPQINMVARWQIPDMIRLGNMISFPTYKDLWYPEVKGQDYAVENRVLSDSLSEIKSGNYSLADQKRIFYDAQQAIHDKGNNPLWQSSYKAMEDEGTARSWFSYFTGIYPKPYTDGQAEIYRLMGINTALKSAMNNEAQTQIFDLPTDPQQRWDAYKTFKSTPEGWTANLYSMLGWVTDPAGNPTDVPAERAKYLAQKIDASNMTDAHYQALASLNQQFQEQLAKLPVGAPYNQREPIYAWYDAQRAVIEKTMPLTYERLYGTYKPTELIAQEISNKWFQLLNNTKPTWNTNEKYQDYLDRVAQWQNDMIQFAPKLMNGTTPDGGFMNRPDILAITNSLHPDQPIGDIWATLVAQSNAQGLRQYDLGSDTVLDALNKAWDATYFQPYWQAMEDPNSPTHEYLKGYDYEKAQYDFLAQHPQPPSDQELYQWIADNYGDRFSLAEVSKWANYSGAYNINEEQGAAKGKDWQNAQDIWNLLSWGGPSKGSVALSDALAASKIKTPGSIDLWYSTSGTLFDTDPAKLQAFHDALMAAAQSINLQPPTRDQLVEYVAAQHNYEDFKTFIGDKINPNILNPTTNPDGTVTKSIMEKWYGDGVTAAMRKQFKLQGGIGIGSEYAMIKEYYHLQEFWADKNPIYAKYYMGRNVIIPPSSLIPFGGSGNPAPLPLYPNEPQGRKGTVPNSDVTPSNGVAPMQPVTKPTTVPNTYNPIITFPSGFVSTIGGPLSVHIQGLMTNQNHSPLSTAAKNYLIGLSKRHPEWGAFITSVLRK